MPEPGTPEYQRMMYAKHREKRVAAAREYRRRNREIVNAKAKERYEADRDAINARRKESRKVPENRTKQYIYQRDWLERNPDKAQRFYAKNLLAEQVGVPARDIPDDLADAKIEQLKISRWVREQLERGEQ